MFYFVIVFVIAFLAKKARTIFWFKPCSHVSIPVTDILASLGLLDNDVVGALDGMGGGLLSAVPSTWPVPLTITPLRLSLFVEGAGGGIEGGNISEGLPDWAALLKCSPSSTEINFMTRVCPVFLIRLTTWR